MPAPIPSHKKSLLASPLKPVLPSQTGGVLHWSRLYGSARGLAIVHIAREHPGPLLVVTHGVHAAEQLQDEIRFYAAQGRASAAGDRMSEAAAAQGHASGMSGIASDNESS